MQRNESITSFKSYTTATTLENFKVHNHNESISPVTNEKYFMKMLDLVLNLKSLG